MKIISSVALLTIITLSLSGCSDNSQELNTLQEQIDGLSTQIEVYEEQSNIQTSGIEKLNNQLGDIEKDYITLKDEYEEKVFLIDSMMDFYHDKRDAAYVSVYEEGYDVVETELGFLTFSVTNVEEYLTGYNVDITIGNPNNVTFNGLDLKVICYSESYESTDVVDISITDKIIDGKWNNVTITIPNIDAKFMDSLAIEAYASSISLSTN